jgi:hypothetical protein
VSTASRTEARRAGESPEALSNAERQARHQPLGGERQHLAHKVAVGVLLDSAILSSVIVISVQRFQLATTLESGRNLSRRYQGVVDQRLMISGFAMNKIGRFHDRLARSMKDLQDIVYELKARGVALRATEQPVDTSTAAGKAFVDMLGVFADDAGGATHNAEAPGRLREGGSP